ncbi:hypothetical protein KCP78_03725 [Salmonella enterica subsp. enterica]|nr:hypothetical protein KCP78_03725 [Salmonella enterica subsp. enterica]
MDVPDPTLGESVPLRRHELSLFHSIKAAGAIYRKRAVRELVPPRRQSRKWPYGGGTEWSVPYPPLFDAHFAAGAEMSDVAMQAFSTRAMGAY